MAINLIEWFFILHRINKRFEIKFHEQEPASPSTPGTPSVVEDSADIPTSPNSESHEEKGPSSRIKLNHPPEVIVGNMNELTLRKRTVDKCVANFVSYSCYLS